MSQPTPDWDRRDPTVQQDQIAAHDRMRSRCPVAHDAEGVWSVLGHAEAVEVLDDPETYSSVVSRHLHIPSGMDAPEHTPWRALVDAYFTPEQVNAFEPVCRMVAKELVAGLPLGSAFEVQSLLGDPFAAGITCAFMGWPESLREPLAEWIRRNHAATRSLEPDDVRLRELDRVALEFDGHIREQLEERRGHPGQYSDPTARLVTEQVDGRLLDDAEIVSIVRNWTVGELGTIAACVGIVLDALARNPVVQAQLRADPSLVDTATDEILRAHAPLVANRRRTTRPTRIGGRDLPAGASVLVLWSSANRDEKVFGDPDELRLDRDPADNLVYGRGVHHCPGAGLSRMELRVLVEEIFAATTSITAGADDRRVPARYPAGGLERVEVTLV